MTLLTSSLQRLCVAALAMAPAIASTQNTPEQSERASLSALESSELESQRAGHPASPSLEETERSGLESLQAQSMDLPDQRAGDLSNEELTTILLVLGIVALIVIIV